MTSLSDEGSVKSAKTRGAKKAKELEVSNLKTMLLAEINRITAILNDLVAELDDRFDDLEVSYLTTKLGEVESFKNEITKLNDRLLKLTDNVVDPSIAEILEEFLADIDTTCSLVNEAVAELEDFEKKLTASKEKQEMEWRKYRESIVNQNTKSTYDKVQVTRDEGKPVNGVANLEIDDSKKEKEVVNELLTTPPCCTSFPLKELTKQDEIEVPKGVEFGNFCISYSINFSSPTAEVINQVKEVRVTAPERALVLHEMEVLSTVTKLEVNEFSQEKRSINQPPQELERNLEEYIPVVPKEQSTLKSISEFESTVKHIYDPIDFPVPYLPKEKRILQKSINSQVDWDDPLPSNMLERWECWISHLEKNPDSVTIGRKTERFREMCSAELDEFRNSSLEGYVICLYVRPDD